MLPSGIMDWTEILDFFYREFTDLEVKKTAAEISVLHRSPGAVQGIYFASIKDHDTGNDESSHLDRKFVYRFSIRISEESYETLFGPLPKSSVVGGRLIERPDADLKDVWIPHPKHAHLAWICVLSPTRETFESMIPYIRESYQLAVLKARGRLL